jgi:hypothetical protein
MKSVVRTVLVSALLTLLSCTPGGSQVVVIFPSGETGSGPLRSSARAQEIKRQIDVLLGHSVSIEMDGLLAAQFADTRMDGVLAGLARELGDMKAAEPEAFAGATRKLERIRYEYSAIALTTTVKLSEQSLSIVVANSDACACTKVGDALAAAYVDPKRSALEAATLASVSDNDLPAYVSALIRQRNAKTESRSRSLDIAAADLELFDALLAADLRAIKLPKEKAKPARAAIYREVRDSGATLVRAYRNHSTEVARLAPNSNFRLLEQKYVSFLSTRWNDALEPYRTTMMRGVLETWNQPASFQGFDRMAFALRTVNAWIAAGAPLETRSNRSENLYEEDEADLEPTSLLCPIEIDGRQASRMRCVGSLYEYLKADPARLSAFIARVMTSPRASALLFRNLTRAEDEVATWSHFESNEASWSALARMLLVDHRNDSKELLFEEASRIWRKYPSRRPLAALVLGSIDGSNHGKLEPRFKALAAEGVLLGERDFDAFLTEGPLAWEHVGTLWPLLARGFSRAKVMSARFDQLKESSGETITLIRTRYCEDSIEERVTKAEALREIATLASALETWAHNHPGQEQIYRTDVEALRAETCKLRLKDLKRKQLKSGTTGPNMKDEFRQ